MENKSITLYDAARFALQQAVVVDEVKDIRDKAQAMAAYARQAKDTALVEWATEIKVRAERKAGQMLAEMPKHNGAPPRYHDVTTPPKTLDEIGISKNQSSRWQKLAAVPDDLFEQAVAAAKDVAGEVTTAAMLRIERANRPPVTPPATTPAPVDNSEYGDTADYGPSAAELAEITPDDVAAHDMAETERAADDERKRKAMEEDFAAFVELLNCDDPLAVAVEKRRIAEERYAGMQAQNNVLIKTVKRLQARLRKANLDWSV